MASYATLLLGCGATCIRIQENVARIAEAFGVIQELTIMPGHCQLMITDKETDEFVLEMQRIKKKGISFNINTKLSELSWKIADKKVNLDEAIAQMEEIINTPHENSTFVLWAASLANMSFCYLFGGDPQSMITVLFATLAGYRVKQDMLGRGVDTRLVFMCSSFISSVIACGAMLFHWGNTPDIALATSVLYLIPGVPYINSVNDMLNHHYVSAFSRIADALVLTACLSVGLVVGFFIMGLSIF